MSTPVKIYACVSDQGTAMSETILTEAEYNNPHLRAEAEQRALRAGDCSKIEWHEVSKNEYVVSYFEYSPDQDQDQDQDQDEKE